MRSAKLDCKLCRIETLFHKKVYYHYHLTPIDRDKLPRCLKEAWVAQHYKADNEAIEVFLTQTLDMTQLQELRKASSLVESPNSDRKPDIQKLRKMFADITDIKKRNEQILKAIEEGYSQHMIAKVLGISQPAVYGVVKRNKR